MVGKTGETGQVLAAQSSQPASLGHPGGESPEGGASGMSRSTFPLPLSQLHQLSAAEQESLGMLPEGGGHAHSRHSHGGATRTDVEALDPRDSSLDPLDPSLAAPPLGQVKRQLISEYSALQAMAKRMEKDMRRTLQLLNKVDRGDRGGKKGGSGGSSPASSRSPTMRGGRGSMGGGGSSGGVGRHDEPTGVISLSPMASFSPEHGEKGSLLSASTSPLGAGLQSSTLAPLGPLGSLGPLGAQGPQGLSSVSPDRGSVTGGEMDGGGGGDRSPSAQLVRGVLGHGVNAAVTARQQSGDAAAAAAGRVGAGDAGEGEHKEHRANGADEKRRDGDAVDRGGDAGRAVTMKTPEKQKEKRRPPALEHHHPTGDVGGPVGVDSKKSFEKVVPFDYLMYVDTDVWSVGSGGARVILSGVVLD